MKPKSSSFSAIGPSKHFAGALCALLLVAASPLSAQIPDFITLPEDGGEFEDVFTISFLTTMQDPIALEFSGTGGIEFDCVWNTFGGLIPNQFLDCTPQSALPVGSTVTWTINPDGTGFTTEAGTVIPTSSGTFIVAGGSTGVVISPFPGQGEVYDPELDGPVTFSFSEEMDTSDDPNDTVSFNQGTWTCVWADLTTISCSPEGTPPPGDYNYQLIGLSTLLGDPVPLFNGTFTIEGGTGGDLTVTPFPALGATYDPLNDGPVTFVFSEEMDETVDPQSAIQIAPGNWFCSWADSLTVECVPTSALTQGSYGYSLTDFRSLSGQTLSEFFGSFMVTETGGTGGTPAPNCPAVPVPLPFPKTLSVCGGDFFVWDYVSLFASSQTSGFALAGWSTLGQDELASLVFMDSQGNITTTVMAQESGIDLIPGIAPNRLLALHEIATSNRVAVGVYQLDNALNPVFEQGLVSAGGVPEATYLSDGSVVVVEDLDTEIQLTVLTPSGSVAWAKRYASAAFGAGGGGGLPGLGASQWVALLETSTGLLLDVAQTSTTLDGTTLTTKSTNLLTHLSADGTVQWAKRYTGLDTFSPPTVSSLRGGGFILQATDTTLSGDTDFNTDTILIRLDSTGALVWGNRIAGPSLQLWDEAANGNLLVGGHNQEQDSDIGSSVIGILSNAGTLETQVKLGYLAGSYGFGRIDNNQILYSLMASAGGSDPDTALVGSSSLQLDNWIWRQYAEPVDSALLVPDPAGPGVLFSAHRESNHSVDLIHLDDNLQASAPCTLFTNADVQVTNTTFATSPASVVIAPETVTATTFTPELINATIGLQSFTVAELPICEDGPVEPAQAVLEVRDGGANQLIIEFDSVTGVNYTLQHTSNLPPANWDTVEIIPGTGSRIVRNLDREANESYYQVVTSAQ